MKVRTQESLREEAQYLRLCVYGEPGSGKTWLLASAALDELTAPVLFLEYRAQIASLQSNPKFIQAIEDKRLVIVTLEDYSELEHVYTWLSSGSGSKQGFDELFEGQMPSTVVMDSLTELQRAEVLRIAGNRAGSFKQDLERPEIKHWGSLLNQFTLLAHLFYNLPYHVVFAGLEAVDYGDHSVGEAPPIAGRRIALQGQGQRQFPAYSLTLMRMERVRGGHRGYTYSVVSKTKEQTGKIPPKIDNPTLPTLVKMLRKEEG